MRDFRDAKAMAQTLRDALKVKSISVSHSESLELVAKTLGFHDWNVLSATIQSSSPMAAPPDKTSARLPGANTVIPIAPMRDVVFFPQLITPIFVGREKTRNAIEHAAGSDGRLLVVTQKRPEDDDPGFDALHSVGVIAGIISCVETGQGNMRVKVSCSDRTAIVRPVDGDFLSAEVATIGETQALDPEAFIRAREISRRTKASLIRRRRNRCAAMRASRACSRMSWSRSWKSESTRCSGSWRPAMWSPDSIPFLAGCARSHLQRRPST